MPETYLEQLAEKEGDGAVCVPIAMSQRELLIFGMICDGQTTKTIASALSISPYTVNNHRKNIIKKTGCKTAIDLFKYGVTHDLLATA